MITHIYRRKLKDIRYKYGNSAVDYFSEHPYCEDCEEDRLVVLNVHHVNGKSEDVFRILCFNCHMIEHNKDESLETFKTYVKHKLERDLIRSNKDNEILEMLNRNVPMRNIIKTASTSLVRVKRVAVSAGFKITPRVGYSK